MKVELPEGGRLQPGPAGNVVMATCSGRDGRPNIITLGMYMPISRRPPLVCIGVAPQRFSHTLLEETGEFVINTPSIDLEEQMHFCGVKSGRDVDKFKETGLTPIPSLKVGPPRIEECLSHMECKVVQAHVCGDHTLFVGEVVATTVDEEYMEDGSLDVLKARPIVQKNHVYFTVTDRK
ncbi:MAG TPA: flavin reductase family protein [Patescibacteria group bacterium]|nr:flavin reductase family protein [Patescibacteria group bacterium]